MVDDRLPGEDTVSKKHVAETLADHHEHGRVRRGDRAGKFGGDTWNASAVTDADVSGEADLTPEGS